MAQSCHRKETAWGLMAVICPLNPGQAAELPLPASGTVKTPLTRSFHPSQVLRSPPQERESLPVTVGVPNSGADLQSQAPVGERLPDWVAAISPVSPEQVADPPLPASEIVKTFLIHSFPPSQVLRSLPREREPLPVPVGVPNSGADLQDQVPVGKRPLDWVVVIFPLPPGQVAERPRPASETVKAFLACHCLPDSVPNPPQQ